MSALHRLLLAGALLALVQATCVLPVAAQAAPAPAASGFPSALKDVPLGDEGRVLLSLGGELRARAEAWRSFGFLDAPARDDEFLLTRVLLNGGLRVGESVQAFVEVESALAFDRDLPGGRRTLDVDQLDLQQAWVGLGLPSVQGADLRLLLGRQELSYGKQRLVSPLPWSNSQRSWDAARLVLERDGWRGDAFYSRYAEIDKYELNDWQQGPDFWGVYVTGKLGGGTAGAEGARTLDLYLLGLDDELARYERAVGEEERRTVGVRYAGKAAGSEFDFDLEGGFQWGEVADQDVEAYFFAAEVGQSFPTVAWKPRVSVGFDYASGDGDSGDGELGTFNQLFPLGHAYLGYMDFVGRQNIVALAPSVTVRPAAGWTLLVRGHLFELANDGDALYNAGGGIVRPAGPSNGQTEVGRELDVVATWKLTPLTTLEAGYGHFFVGDFLDGEVPADDMDWLYLQAQLTF